MIMNIEKDITEDILQFFQAFATQYRMVLGNDSAKTYYFTHLVL